MENTQADKLADQTAVENPLPFLIVRKSAIFLVVNLILLEIGFVIIYLILAIPFNLFAASPATGLLTTNIMIFIILLLLLTKIVVGVLICLAWVRTYYEIHTERVIHYKGILVMNETIFSTKNVQEIWLTQDVLGKIFNYGTVTLYNPVLREKFHLRGISQASKYCDLIERQIRTGAAKGDTEPVMILRNHR